MSLPHACVRLDRTYPVPSSAVFAAWSRRDAVLDWCSPGPGWTFEYDAFDFRTGGTDVCRFGPEAGPVWTNRNRYEQILPQQRIVYTSTLSSGGALGFAGLVTVEFEDAGGQCRMLLTEQGAYLDGSDDSAGHRAGWNDMLDALGEHLQRRRVA
ncbi:SRPBCC domain-containing protein [Luteimonas sp. SJ-92]|uniref:SRPBCC domain-containing protein n=1 Tax=Luteimonas salinisoli TaxID=2752307 RepID=A0A853JD42_9GAMM|nr:SRPBCC domain-containing protein [Luteimonas salinisoli]NZA26490.1 SRPBCC domain-containing protein [Luteimonas salinisoli]